MSEHETVISNSIQELESKIPMQSILPEKANKSSGDVLIVPDIMQAIKYGNRVPEGTRGENNWNFMLESVKAHYLRLRYGILNMEEGRKCDDLLEKMVAKLFVRKPESMRDLVKKNIYESVLYDFEILLCVELCKRSNVESGEKYSNYVQEILKGYKIGGWPCGWRGDFPQGNALVYWPYDKNGNWIQEEYELDL